MKMFKKILSSIIVGVTLFFIVGAVHATTISLNYPLNDIIDFEVISSDKTLKLNNLSIKTADSFLSRGLDVITVSFSAQNRSDKAICFSFSITAIGDGGVLFVLSAEPMMGMISAQTTETITETVYIDKGANFEGSQFLFQIVGDFK